ncbi:MAG: 5-formyltetrahydrofolate cyclo-ligase [Panacagrimonas sp.]
MAPDKSELRRHFRARRKAMLLSQRQKAARLAARKLMRQTTLRRARRIAVYWPVGSELSTLPLIHALLRRRQAVYLPRLASSRRRVLRFGQLLNLSRTHIGPHGIGQARQTKTIAARQLDVIVLPLLAFTANGARLGQGGGHYDRCLQPLRHKRIPWRMGYGFACQQAEVLQPQSWDIPLHAACTEKGVRKFRVSTNAGVQD